MPVLIRDEHLEQTIDTERQRRGDATMAKTLGDLARERLMEIEIEQRTQPVSIPAPASSERGQPTA